MRETWVQSLGWENPLEKGMATQFCILAWRIPWTEKPGGLQSIGPQRVGRDWVGHTNSKQNFNIHKVKNSSRRSGDPIEECRLSQENLTVLQMNDTFAFERGGKDSIWLGWKIRRLKMVILFSSFFLSGEFFTKWLLTGYINCNFPCKFQFS